MTGAPPSPRRSRRAAWLLLALLAAFVVLLGGLFRPSGGLRGRYFIRGEGGVEIPVHERLDADLDFSAPQGLDAAYLFHWDMRRHGFPASMPPYSIHWTGLLRAPRDGTYGFAVDAQGEVRLSIDAQPVDLLPDTVTERPLSAGWHPIAVDYTLVQGDARCVLSWRPPGRSLRPIPSSALAPDAGSTGRIGARRLLGWILLLAVAGAAAAVALLARRPEGPAARLVALLREERVTLALGALVILAAILRFQDYALVPFHHETADEYQHAWEGWTLLHEGTPRAWTTFPDRYPIGQTVDFRWFGDRYIVAHPYYDHPPLFSVIVGLVVSVQHALAPASFYPPPWDYLSCTLPVMRVVPVLLSLFGILLLYRLARHYGASEKGALLAALVYAVLPLIVLSHRLVKAESLLSLLFMGTVLAVRRCEESGRVRDAVLVGLLCGLSIWSKATGVAVLAVALVLLLARRRYRAAGLALGVAGGCVALYLLYAWALDLGIFLKVVEAQSTTKWVALESLQDLLTGKIVTRWFGRGWYLWLLLCAGIAALRRERALLVPLAVYATVIALTADHRVIYGWYRIPLYPFLCVAAGILLEEMLDEADLYRVFPFAIAAVSTGALYAWSGSPAVVQGRPAVAAFALAALAPYLLRLAVERPLTVRLARAATWGLFGFFLVTSVMTVGRLLEIYSATRGLR